MFDPPKGVLTLGNGTAFLGTDKVVVSPIRPEVTESTPRTRTAPSVFEKLWFQCTQCGWGEQQDSDETDGYQNGNSCPECGIGPIRSSKMD